MSKCHQNLDMWGNMLLAIHVETFFEKNVAQIEVVTCRNMGVSRNLDIFLPTTVWIIIFYMLTSHTLSRNISENVPKICKIAKLLHILRLLVHETFGIEKLRQLEKKILAMHQKQSKNI